MDSWTTLERGAASGFLPRRPWEDPGAAAAGEGALAAAANKRSGRGRRRPAPCGIVCVLSFRAGVSGSVRK